MLCYIIKEDENMNGINQSTYAQTDTTYRNMKTSESASSTTQKTSETDGKIAISFTIRY